jgi:hypothetical protein
MGRQWFWLPLPEQKWLGCRAENPASIMNANNFQFGNLDKTMHVEVEQSGKFLK